MQTLRNTLFGRDADLSEFPEERWTIDLADGTGDVLIAAFHEPGHDAGRPAVILIHGLTGCEDSRYVLNSAASLLRAGYPVIRLNLRGAGPSLPLCREYYHAGRTADLGHFLRQARKRLSGRPMVAVGYSLGGNLLLKYLGETGADSLLAAGVSVSAPIDLKAASQAFLRPRNAFYRRYILYFLRRDAVRGREPLPEPIARAIRAARTVYEFDDVFVAPRYGFADAEDYYARSSALQFLDGVARPALVIHARNDPWIPMAGYDAFPWESHRWLRALLPKGGGHVGFHASGSRTPWHDRAIAAFLEETPLR